MNNDEMRAALDAAKKYKVERVAEAEAAVRELQANIASAEARLEAWRSMIPADVLRIMQDDSRREASNSAEAARARDKEALHAAALNEAYTQGKGILPPDNASKSTSFGFIGAMIFGMFTSTCSQASIRRSVRNLAIRSWIARSPDWPLCGLRIL